MSVGLGVRVGRALLWLYPEPWRLRYAEEVDALLEDDPPGLLGLSSLVLGALRAHLRPQASWRAAAGRETLMRLSVGWMFAAWIGISLAGIGFQKDTEDHPYQAAATHHPLLGVAHDIVLAGACLGAISVAIGGLPLLWQAMLAARARRDKRLAMLIALPALAVLAFVVVALLLWLVAPRRGNGFPASYVLEILTPWMLAMLACAAVCAFVPRAVMRHVGHDARSLRRACLAGLSLAAAMCLVTGGIALYAILLWIDEPGLTTVQTGPYGASTGVMASMQAGYAVLFALLGALAARRGRRAAYSMSLA